MRIVWTDKATQQRKSLLSARKDFAGAISARKAFEEIKRVLILATVYPEIGKAGMVDYTRELFPLRYRLVYQVDEQTDTLIVIAILPQWQKWPEE